MEKEPKQEQKCLKDGFNFSDEGQRIGKMHEYPSLFASVSAFSINSLLL